MNLPRDTRYKQEYTILVGLIPGPKEPKHDINSFLEPFVEELLKFWRGVELDVAGSGKKIFRCALLCCACDLPAGRKVCGFLGHSARLGCSRCLKEFPGSWIIPVLIEKTGIWHSAFPALIETITYKHQNQTPKTRKYVWVSVFCVNKIAIL